MSKHQKQCALLDTLKDDTQIALLVKVSNLFFNDSIPAGVS